MFSFQDNFLPRFVCQVFRFPVQMKVTSSFDFKANSKRERFSFKDFFVSTEFSNNVFCVNDELESDDTLVDVSLSSLTFGVMLTACCLPVSIWTRRT